MSVLTRRKKPSTGMTPEGLDAARRRCERVFGLKLNQFDTLDDDERVQFAHFVKALMKDAGSGLNLANLQERDMRRLEVLMEKAAGRPGFFNEARTTVRLQAKAAELRAAALKPNPRPIVMSEGDVLIPREVIRGIFGDGGKPSMDFADVGMLVWSLACFQNPDLDIGPRSGKLDAEGITYGASGPLKMGSDLDGRLFVMKSVKRLVKMQLLEHEKRGNGGLIRPGKWGRAILAAGRVS